MNIDSLDFDKSDGLIPVVIQHAETNQVLMLGYMNREAVEKTLELKKVTFYSRSKERLWTKGESSGNHLNLVEMQPDCDQDALLVRALPEGPTCHTGHTSCFYEEEFTSGDGAFSFLTRLENLLRDRKQTLPEGSYTSRMFQKGLDKITQKVGEEAVETVIASKNDDEGEFVYEASDLLFHLMLLLVEKEVPFDKLVEELERRHQ